MLAGPLCGRALQDLGAQVIKIEPPGVDDTRFAAPVNPNWVSGYYAKQNAGKRNLCINLNRPEAREIAVAPMRVGSVGELEQRSNDHHLGPGALAPVIDISFTHRHRWSAKPVSRPWTHGPSTSRL